MKLTVKNIVSPLIHLIGTGFVAVQLILAAEVPAYDRSVFEGFPESGAIEQMLLQEKEYGILQTASKVSVKSMEDFGTAVIHHQSGGGPADRTVFLLKEKGSWVAYSTLPIRKDHPGVFFLLASDYCARKYGEIQGMAYLDETWKNTDSSRRTIHFKCMQLVNNEWQDHELGLVYEFEPQEGWRITGESDIAPPPAGKKIRGTQEDSAEEEKQAQQQYPLHLAASLSPLSPENEANAIQLVADGADVNFRNEYGQTPLHILCYGCLSPRLVQAMLDAGADLSIRTGEGQTPLDLINMMLAGGNQDNCLVIREMLLKAGAR